MEKITLTNLCGYIYNCINNNEKIHRNYYGGFFIIDEISVMACNYSNLKEITVKPYTYRDNIRENDPTTILKIKDFTEEEWLEYQKALLAIQRYNENKIIEIIKNGEKLELYNP